MCRRKCDAIKQASNSCCFLCHYDAKLHFLGTCAAGYVWCSVQGYNGVV